MRTLFPPLAFHLYEEMSFRKWNTRDVARRMPGDFGTNLLAFEMMMCVHQDGLILGTLANDIAEAFSLSPNMINALDKSWRVNKDSREPWKCPDDIFQQPLNDNRSLQNAKSPTPA